MRLIIKISLFLIGIVLAIAGTFSYSQLFTPIKFPDVETGSQEAYLYELPEGQGLSHFSKTLLIDGYINHPKLINLYARLRGYDKRVKAGEYQFRGPLNVDAALTILTEGKSIQHSVTIVEGHALSETLADLMQNENFSDTDKTPDPAELSAYFELSRKNPEGLFFADTYFFTKGSSYLDLLAQANKRLNEVLNEEWNMRAEKLPFESPYEALILASIVEKETGQAFERPLIAGVFINRLELGMRLQTDPTVIYGVGDAYDGNITSAHLRTYTPYNTYRISGLPPTPIANVGREAINAVMHPQNTDKLYFVAKGDGTHHFSKNLEDHNSAVRKYQWKRKSDYRSAPK